MVLVGIIYRGPGRLALLIEVIQMGKHVGNFSLLVSTWFGSAVTTSDNCPSFPLTDGSGWDIILDLDASPCPLVTDLFVHEAH